MASSSHVGTDDSRLLIDGELRRASDGGSYDNIDPTTEAVVGVAPNATVHDVDAAVAAARRAFDSTSWARDHEFRLHCLEQLRDAVVRNFEPLREILVTELGCPVSLTKGRQLDEIPLEINAPIEIARDYPWEKRISASPSATGGILYRVPRGVVSALTPFNYPILFNLKKLVPSLAAGCTVVLKGANDTPWSATALGRLILEETDIPAGVVNVLTSTSIETAAAMTTHPDVDMVDFVGSTAVGRLIMAQAAPTLKKLVLELGGKSAMIILDDADVAAVARTAAGVGLHSGQGCSRLTRFLVPRSRYQEAIDSAVAAFAEIVVGDPRDPTTIQGPQISGRQQKKVIDYIEGAKLDGARCVYGGDGRPQQFDKGYFVEPTLFADVDPHSKLAQTELFGPVAVLIPYDTVEEAIAMANDSEYGLNGAVSSADPERALEVARQIRTGNMVINGAAPGLDLPFGGWKQSGIGVDNGRAGFEEHLQTMSIGWPSPNSRKALGWSAATPAS